MEAETKDLTVDVPKEDVKDVTKTPVQLAGEEIQQILDKYGCMMRVAQTIQLVEAPKSENA